MSAIQFHPNPTEGMIINVSQTKQMRFENGRWRLHTNNIPNLVESSYLGVPYISEEAPALPFSHKLWLKVSEGALHYQYDDGETVQWIAISGGTAPGGGGGSGREVLTENRTYYVAKTGNDSNDGLTTGTPFLTIQKAMDVAGSLDFSGYNVTIKIANGTYSESVEAREFVGDGVCLIEGDISSPWNVQITPASNSALKIRVPKKFDIRGVKTSSTNASTIWIANGAVVTGQDFEIGQAGQYGSGIYVEKSASMTITGPYRVSGAGYFHLRAWDGGQITMTTGTITPTQAIYFTTNGAFAMAGHHGRITIYGVTFVNPTFFYANRYRIEAMGLILTNYGGESYLPGTSNGLKYDGGVYK